LSEFNSIEDWYRELKKIAKERDVTFLVSSDIETYKEYFEEGTSPLDSLLDEISYTGC